MSMRFCPRTAQEWGIKPPKHELADMCRRQYRRGDALCDSCPLAEKFGVVDKSTPNPIHQPEQGKLW